MNITKNILDTTNMQSQQIATAIIILIYFQINGYVQQSVTCGRRKVHHEALITKGIESKEGEWPWHAAIYHISNTNFEYKCGGTLINSNSVLTAAHCVYQHGRPIIPERVLVWLGTFNLLNSGTNTQNFDVIHVLFQNNNENSFINKNYLIGLQNNSSSKLQHNKSSQRYCNHSTLN